MSFTNNQRVIKLFLVCVLVFSGNFHVAMAADYFMATTGNDGNRGTIQQPFRTLERAVKALASGDRLLIRGGTYRRGTERLDVPSGGGSWETATTIAAYNNEQVIITPYDTTPRTGTRILEFANDRSWIIIDGLILDGARNKNNDGGGSIGFLPSWNGHHFRLSNTEIRHTANSGIQTRNAHSNEFINLKIHDSNHDLPAGDPNFGKRVYGIYLDSGNNLVKGCDIYNNRGYGISAYSGNDFKPDNNVISKNKLHHNEMTGLMIATGTGNVVINNLVYKNGTGEARYDRYGIIISGAPNTLVANNTLYGNTLGEVQVYPNARTTTIKNNILAGQVFDDVLFIHKGSSATVIENNLVVGRTTEPGRLVRSQEPSASLKGNLIGKQYDPKFKSANTEKFYLTSESSARGEGQMLDQVKTDFDGIKRTLAAGVIGAYGFDVGAYQYVE